MSFKETLKVGKVGESKIARWLISKGNKVLPVYEIAENQFKGPSLYCEGGRLVAPDLLVFNTKGNVIWLEVKTKTAFTWHRITQKWVTGIDLKHYFSYLEVTKRTGLPLWIMFLHGVGKSKDTPDGKNNPTGLFGENILILEKCENHRHENWGTSGMVYWAVENLKVILDAKKVNFLTNQ